MFVIIVIILIAIAFIWLIIYGGSMNKTDEERFLEDEEQSFIINKDNDVYRRILGKLDDDYVSSIHNLKLTKEQEEAYKKLTFYNLSKEKELYDEDYYNRLCDDYYWLMVSLIREDKIIDYVEKHCV